MAAVAETVVIEAKALALGRAIRALRQERGLTQRDLAERLGVQHTAVCMLETRGVFNLTVLEQAAWALDAELAIELRPRVIG